MTLHNLLDEIDRLSADDLEQVKAHILGRSAPLGTEPLGKLPELDDFDGMFGIIHTEVTDLSVHAREYLHEIFQEKHERSD